MDKLAAKAARVRESQSATTPLRQRAHVHISGMVYDTPYRAFLFDGDGPYWEFELNDWDRVGVADALNYFRQIGAIVLQHERRPWVFSEDGSTHYCDYFLVEWHDSALTPAVSGPSEPSVKDSDAQSGA